MLDPLVYTIEVPCNQEKAFGIFVNEMDTWWPLAKRTMSAVLAGKPAKAIRVDARQGGKIIEIAHDGAELLWGTIMSYDPHDLLKMDFHMGLPAPETPGTVEVRFTPLGSDRTQVELTHSNWEAYGDMAEMMRGGYGSGWVIIFEQGYKSACGG